MYYKFRNCEQRTWEILINRELYFSKPKNLNDPLDTSLSVAAEYNRALEETAKAELYSDGKGSSLLSMIDLQLRRYSQPEVLVSEHVLLDEFLQDRAILSLSMNPNDALLWSHYANGHRGICIGFNDSLVKMEGVSGDGPMIYSPTPQLKTGFLYLISEFRKICRPWEGVHPTAEQNEEFRKLKIHSLMAVGLFNKSEKWAYESEYRLISPREGNHSYEPSMLATVILGSKTSDSDERTVRNILKAPDFSHVKLQKAYNIPGTFSFAAADI